MDASEEMKANGTYYTIDEDRGVIIYDPYCNNYGKFDLNLKDSTQNMAEIAERTKMSVEAKFNGTVFQMTPGMTPEDGKKAFDEAFERARKEYRKSPEYQAEKNKRELSRIKNKLQEKADDKLIQGLSKVIELKLFITHIPLQSRKT